MNAAEWLRSRRRAEAVLTAYTAPATEPKPATNGTVTPSPTLTIEVTPAPYVMPADAAAHYSLRAELDRRSLRDGLERCGCWPRYTGSCHCAARGAR